MRKKTLLAILFAVLFAGALNAQIQKGDWLLGGTLGYSFNNTTGNYANSNTNLSPHIGYAIGNNLVLGLNFNFGYSTQKNESPSVTDKVTDLNFSSSAFLKKYYVIKNKVGWYGALHAGGGLTTTNQYDSAGTKTYHSKNWSITAGFVPGIYYQATPFLQLTADFGGINYQYTSPSGGGSHSSSFNINFLSSFAFGVDFILGKHSGN